MVPSVQQKMDTIALHRTKKQAIKRPHQLSGQQPMLTQTAQPARTPRLEGLVNWHFLRIITYLELTAQQADKPPTEYHLGCAGHGSHISLAEVTKGWKIKVSNTTMPYSVALDGLDSKKVHIDCKVA